MDTETLNARTMNSPQSNHENGVVGRQPDPDSIKMFVGQVPRSMDENDLKNMFEQYGPVFQINVLRDKVSGQSKGCCFVTFYTRKAALDAQNALHNIKTMPGMHHPVQMKPADSEKRNGEQANEERKLFIGMLSKKFNETDVKMMFAPFGTIEDCTVLRDQNGQSRGCAFITYSSRQSAQGCIKNMHHSQTMEGCSSPLVVKFADTQKEKEQKKLQQMNASLLMQFGGGGGGGGGTAAALNNLTPQYLALLQQAMANQGNMGVFANMGNLGLNALNLQQFLTALAAASQNPGLLAALAALAGGNSSGGGNNNTNSNSNSSGSNSAAGDASNNLHLQNLQGLAALANAANSPGGFSGMNMQQGNMQGNNMAGGGGANNMGNGGNPNMAALMQAAMGSFNQVANMFGGGGAGGNMPNGGGMGQNNMGGGGGGYGGGGMMQNMGNMSNGNGGGMGNQAGGAHGSDRDNGQSQPVSLSGSLSTSNTSLSGLTGLQNLGNNNMAASPGITNGITTSTSSMDALSQAYSGIQQYAGLSGLLSPATASFPNAFSATAQQLQANNTPAGKQTEGPDGANLFIYHLPQEFSDHDLMQTFMPFGNVISAKVFIDKQTNLSKCFGFVSYDNAVSAQAAIQAMNGFQIGMKRLKVQLKRPKSDSKPY